MLDSEQIRKLRSKLGFSIINEEAHEADIFEGILAIDSATRKMLLGQLFTPEWIADYMAAICIKDPGDRGIEPCFGNGVFITTIAKRLLELRTGGNKNVASQITGIELDPDLFLAGIEKYRTFFRGEIDLSDLHLGSFFEFDQNRNLYDFGMMNPPYVRHEELVSPTLPPSLRKPALLERLGAFVEAGYLSGRANLYVYFFLHLSRFIKEGGRLVAITYNSWLYSSYGALLQKFFLDNFKILYVIDFDAESFEDAIIGSCIVLLEKATGEEEALSRNNNEVHFIRLKSRALLPKLLEATEQPSGNAHLLNRHVVPQAALYHDSKWEKYLYVPTFHDALAANPKLVPLKKLTSCIFRGLEPKSAPYFIIDDATVDAFKINKSYLLPILKDPRTLTSFRTSGLKKRSFLLHAWQPKAELLKDPKATGLLDYLSHLEQLILDDTIKLKTLRDKIARGEDSWYVHKVKRAGEIVFSYIIRENKWFYLNDQRMLTTDNFHNLIPSIDRYALFAVLNSSIVRYFLEVSGRTQGSGLLKVQVYELENLAVPDLKSAPPTFVRALSELGQQLAGSLLVRNGNNSGVNSIISRIDREIFGFLENDLLSRVVDAENKIARERLNRKLARQ
jgi:hypothetical protein